MYSCTNSFLTNQHEAGSKINLKADDQIWDLAMINRLEVATKSAIWLALSQSADSRFEWHVPCGWDERQRRRCKSGGNDDCKDLTSRRVSALTVNDKSDRDAISACMTVRAFSVDMLAEAMLDYGLIIIACVYKRNRDHAAI